MGSEMCIRDREQAKRRGAVVSTNLLDYTEFTELGNILLANWGDFAPALGKKKYAEAYIDRLNGLRNAPMHSRILLPFERELLSGIVGEFLNMMAIYRSQRGPDMMHYPVIESVVDSLGNDASNQPELNSHHRLKVGEQLSFTCRATDPQGRALLWELYVMHGGTAGSYRRVDQAAGNAVAMKVTVDERLVGESAIALIKMKSDGKYHRGGDYDEQRIYTYAVDPPLEVS